MVADLALENRLPAMMDVKEYVAAGGLLCAIDVEPVPHVLRLSRSRRVSSSTGSIRGVSDMSRPIVRLPC